MYILLCKAKILCMQYYRSTVKKRLPQMINYVFKDSLTFKRHNWAKIILIILTWLCRFKSLSTCINYNSCFIVLWTVYRSTWKKQCWISIHTPTDPASIKWTSEGRRNVGGMSGQNLRRWNKIILLWEEILCLIGMQTWVWALSTQ